MSAVLLRASDASQKRSGGRLATIAGACLRQTASRRRSLRGKWINTSAAAILAATALALTTSILGWVMSRHIAGLFQAAITENLPSLGTARELEIALLEQRGFVASYMLDEGNEVWLDELKRREPALSDWLIRARRTAHTAAELEILARLEGVYQEYDKKRDEAVALYERGEVEKAKQVLLEDVYSGYLQTQQLCEDFVACNQGYIESATSRAHRQVLRITWSLGFSAALTFGLGLALLSFSVRRFIAEQRNREYEIRLLAARKVQEQLLSHALPPLPGLDVGSVWQPAEFAAGDYLDYIALPDGSVAVAIGDVCGHGLDAALLAVGTRAYLRSLADSDNEIHEILARMNARLLRDTGGEGRFVTFLLARFDLRSSSLMYANAGHPTGYVLGSSGDVKARLQSQSLPLGVLADVDFLASDPIELAPGDMVILLTDGVLEAASLERECFGADRLLEAVRSHRIESAQEIVNHIYEAVRQHVGSETLADDLTVTVIKRMPQSVLG